MAAAGSGSHSIKVIVPTAVGPRVPPVVIPASAPSTGTTGMIVDKIINNDTLYYSVKSSSKPTQSSLIGDTDHNTGISLLLLTSVWVLLSPPLER